ncbi:hypothetical protein PHK61_21720 [Actinomycetospora lutea]|uniref:hypothetical protein n=1 Tax=Actinomycetospora lutea TaxID=663604 RepID=UPI002366961E|nr:hypothetical protein [Actinomycetospora lutea]MDD7941044.1 hypothetical protein [Actinomycetospora lutea]
MVGHATSAHEHSRLRVGLLVVSSLLVLVAAVGFDVLADEPPVHLLAVALAALIVGAGRLRWSGRATGLFVTMNLAVVGQPAVHALGKLPQAGAELLPHSHGWPHSLSGLLLHVAVAMLVVTLAVLEPACASVVPRLLPLLRGLVQTPPPRGPVRRVRPARRAPRVRAHRLLFSRQAHRRGPPALPALAA